MSRWSGRLTRARRAADTPMKRRIMPPIHGPRLRRVLQVPIALLILAVATGCVRRPPLLPEIPAGTTVRVRPGDAGSAIRHLAMKEYVKGSVLAEVPLTDSSPLAARRTAEVQAILARTYALANLGRHVEEGFDLCATTHCQVYRPAASQPPALVALATDAVRRTEGVVVTYERRPIQALFHADCGGHTSSAQSVWGGPTPPYLNGARDRFCDSRRPPGWRFVLDASVLRDALNGNERTAVGSHLSEIEVQQRDAAGRAVHITLRGERTRVVRAAVVRAVLVRRFGPHSFKSTRLDVRPSGDTFVFEGTGYGHGVGLCQIGAIARAAAGHTPAEILGHYYPGTTLERLDWL